MAVPLAPPAVPLYPWPVADEGRQPVAIRIARPYPSEEAFLEHELDTLTRTSVVLLGAQSRPQGVVLRFEVTLASGAPLLRGEGRVVGYKPNALNDEPGLTLRFTRLDPRSKALIDRAAALRDARARGTVRPEPPAYEAPVEATYAGAPPSLVSPPSVPPPLPASARPPPVSARPSRGASVPAPSARPTMPPTPSARAVVFEEEEAASTTSTYDQDSLDRLRTGAPPPPAEPEASSAPDTSVPPPPPLTPAPVTVVPVPRSVTEPPAPEPSRESRPARAPATTLSAPADRASLLERLRMRARDLPPARVREILSAKHA